MKRFWISLNLWRCILADIMYILSGLPIKELLDADINRNLKWDKQGKELHNKILRLNYCLLKRIEFRSVFELRMRHHPILMQICDIFLPRMKTIEFGNGGIGGGLMVSHYHCIVFPKEAGKNFRIGPGVVIGRNEGFPTIGDNVYVAANSTIIGNIKIGSNVIVGAGSVVVRDVPDNCIVVGNPAHIVKKIDFNERYLNEIM